MNDYPAMHGPSRPDWNCLACGEPWPCITRKRQLKDLCHSNIRVLVNYMSPYLRDAHREIGGMSTAEITERFVGWCSRPLLRLRPQDQAIEDRSGNQKVDPGVEGLLADDDTPPGFSSP
ncbi:hypothetical protein [Micromonospora rubida]